MQVWGEVSEYKGHRHLLEKRCLQDGWKYPQVVKEPNEAGRVTETEKETIFGEGKTLLEIFEEHTACVKRTHLTTGR